MRNRAVAVALLVVVGWTLVLAAQGTGDTPVLRVDKAQIDLGKVKAGDDAIATFVFHNDGSEAVKIIRAKPS